jgi:hypothetical protein
MRLLTESGQGGSEWRGVKEKKHLNRKQSSESSGLPPSEKQTQNIL